jgi:hypothetical protein
VVSWECVLASLQYLTESSLDGIREWLRKLDSGKGFLWFEFGRIVNRIVFQVPKRVPVSSDAPALCYTGPIVDIAGKVVWDLGQEGDCNSISSIGFRNELWPLDEIEGQIKMGQLSGRGLLGGGTMPLLVEEFDLFSSTYPRRVQRESGVS